jgi:hypothetical protein
MVGTNNEATRILLGMLTGDPMLAMESAKEVIGSPTAVEPSLLGEIASNKLYKKWSRIAAVYALGFLEHKGSATTLIRILKNPHEDPNLRGHVAEALGNMRERKATVELGKILFGRGQLPLKKWCIYALAEIGGNQAGSILRQFQATRPTGVAAKELKSALRKT